MPLVSIVMNCYNGDKYLSRALKSIILQKIKVKKYFFNLMIKDFNIINQKNLKFYMKQEMML